MPPKNKTLKKRNKKSLCDFYNSKRCMRFHNYTKKDRERITQQINPISLEEAEKSFEQLQNLSCQKIKTLSTTPTRIGNDVVDYFTQSERLSTKGHVNIDFYTFWYNKKEFSKIDYVQNMLDYYNKQNPDAPEIKIWKYIFNLYFSSISIFKPVIAMNVYCKYQPKHAVLDMTMGWGGRLIGACALNVPKYIGIDLNTDLKTPYQKMKEFMQTRSTTEIELYFQDALEIDYSKFKYDMVLTSPPYYNIEVYGSNNKGKEFDTKEEK